MHNQLTAIKHRIEQNVGKPVLLICRSRRRERKSRGTLEGAYGSVFTVSTLVDGCLVNASYTYSDILTRAVTLKPLAPPNNMMKCSAMD